MISSTLIWEGRSADPGWIAVLSCANNPPASSPKNANRVENSRKRREVPVMVLCHTG